MEELGAEPLQQLLVQIGGWNASSSGFNVSTWSLSKSLKILQNKYNMGGLFAWAVGEDDRNASYHIIQIDQGGLTLPMRENYLNTNGYANVLSEYLDYMTKIVVLLGGNEVDARNQMSAVIDFETKLAEITSKLNINIGNQRHRRQFCYILNSSTRRTHRRRALVLHNDVGRTARYCTVYRLA